MIILIGTTTTHTICGSSCVNQSWIVSSNLLAEWSFDNSFIDLANNHNGIPALSSPTFVTGYFKQAVAFNASLRQSLYTSYILLGNTSFTIDGWLYVTGLPNPVDHCIVALCFNTAPNQCLHINIHNGKFYFGFYFNDLPGNTMIQLDQWMHVAFIFDLTTLSQYIYVNGILEVQGTVTSCLLFTSGNFTIGLNEQIYYPNNTYQVKDETVYLY